MLRCCVMAEQRCKGSSAACTRSWCSRTPALVVDDLSARHVADVPAAGFRSSDRGAAPPLSSSPRRPRPHSPMIPLSRSLRQEHGEAAVTEAGPAVTFARATRASKATLSLAMSVFYPVAGFLRL
ncbi:hypothetical protein ZWY2020_009193 [Hordeum vulgare]|nr:hypothetical protein ZWY2020_009193 [Hordeum vulgare]